MAFPNPFVSLGNREPEMRVNFLPCSLDYQNQRIQESDNYERKLSFYCWAHFYEGSKDGNAHLEMVINKKCFHYWSEKYDIIDQLW